MKRLKDLRKELQKTQKEIAQYLEITVSAYGNYELGQREPDIETLIKLADYFNVSIDYLLGHDKTTGFSPAEHNQGFKETKKVELTPIEDNMLYEFRKLGKEKGVQFQQVAIAYLQQMNKI